MKRLFLTKSLAVVLAVVLVFAAPGTGSYEALAAVVSSSPGSTAVPAAAWIPALGTIQPAAPPILGIHPAKTQGLPIGFQGIGKNLPASPQALRPLVRELESRGLTPATFAALPSSRKQVLLASSLARLGSETTGLLQALSERKGSDRDEALSRLEELSGLGTLLLSKTESERLAAFLAQARHSAATEKKTKESLLKIAKGLDLETSPLSAGLRPEETLPVAAASAAGKTANPRAPPVANGIGRPSQDDPIDAELGALLKKKDLGPETAIQKLAERMEAGPIHAGAYGSEGRFIRLFTALAGKIQAKDPSVLSHASARLLKNLADLRVVRAAPANSNFILNLAVLADDLYLSAYTRTVSIIDRLCLAAVRSKAGAESVKTYAELGILAPKSQTIRAKPKFLYRLAGMFCKTLPGTAGRIAREVERFISPADIGVLGFPSIAEKWALSARLRERLTVFHQRLQRLEANLSLLRSPPSVWELALKVNEGNVQEAAEMLGAIIGQTKRPLRYVEKHILPLHPEAQGADAAFADAAKSYYLLGLIHENTLARFGKSPLYPPGIDLGTPKFWHFYSAAMLAGHLRGLGFSKGWVRIAGSLTAAAYEAYSLPYNLGLDPVGLLALPYQVRDSARDVLSQTAGNGWMLAPHPARERRIGFLTGTFDPPHPGHIGIAQLALDNGLDEVWLLPNYTPSHKPNASPFRERHALVRAMAEREIDLKVMDADFIETFKGDTTRLIQAFQKELASRGSTEFVHLFGMDSFAAFLGSGHLEERVQQYSIWVFDRPGYDRPDIQQGFKDKVSFFETRLPYSSSEMRRRTTRTGASASVSGAQTSERSPVLERETIPFNGIAPAKVPAQAHQERGPPASQGASFPGWAKNAVLIATLATLAFLPPLLNIPALHGLWHLLGHNPYVALPGAAVTAAADMTLIALFYKHDIAPAPMDDDWAKDTPEQLEEKYSEMPFLSSSMLTLSGAAIEEFIFRFLPIGGWMFFHSGPTPGLLSYAAVSFISSYIFGRIHGYGELWSRVFIGMIYAGLFFLTGNILFSVFAHFFHNWFITLLTLHERAHQESGKSLQNGIAASRPAPGTRTDAPSDVRLDSTSRPIDDFRALSSIRYTLTVRNREETVYLVKDADTFRSLVNWRIAFSVFEDRKTGSRMILLSPWKNPERDSSHSVIHAAIELLDGKRQTLREVDRGYLRPIPGTGDFQIYDMSGSSIYESIGSTGHYKRLTESARKVQDAFKSELGIRIEYPDPDDIEPEPDWQ